MYRQWEGVFKKVRPAGPSCLPHPVRYLLCACEISQGADRLAERPLCIDAESVRSVREHGKRARKPLAVFFNISMGVFILEPVPILGQ